MGSNQKLENEGTDGEKASDRWSRLNDDRSRG